MKNSLRIPQLRLFAVVVLLLLGLAITVGSTLAADDSITLQETLTGKYEVTNGAIGLDGTAPGTITVNVPGTPSNVFLYWTGRGSGSGDDTITISINGGAATSITADQSSVYSSNTGFPPAALHFVYAKVLNAASFNTGINTVTVSDMTIYENHGAGLSVYSTDPSFQEVSLSRYWGLDGFFVGWTGEFGPNSQLVCQSFSAATSPRVMQVGMFVGGVDGADRPNSIWYQVGSGPLPVGSIVDAVGATEIATDITNTTPPLTGDQNQNGRQSYDLFERGISVPASSTWACFQIESRSDGPLLGASALWHGLTTALAPAGTTAVNLSAIDANSLPVMTPLLALAALLAAASLLLLHRRRSAR